MKLSYELQPPCTVICREPAMYALQSDSKTAVLQKDCENYSADRSYDACFANLIIPFVVCVLLYGCET